MQVKSIEECSKGTILQYFRPLLSYHFIVSLRFYFVYFWVPVLLAVKDQVSLCICIDLPEPLLLPNTNYSKTCVKQPLSQSPKIGFQDKLSLIWFFTSHQQFFRYIGTGLTVLIKYLARINVSCSRTQWRDASDAWTHGPSVSIQAHYHWATALPTIIAYCRSKVLQNAPRGPALSYHLSLRSLFCLLLSGPFTQVLLYVGSWRLRPRIRSLSQLDMSELVLKQEFVLRDWWPKSNVLAHTQV